MTTEGRFEIRESDIEGFPVKLEGFEGPLDLLLYLIRNQEIDIYDIPIARITKQYLEYVNMMKLLNLEIAGEYLLMAATLIRIKARLLIPRRSETDDQDDDPREELIVALLEYKKFKESSEELQKLELQERQVLRREDFSYLSAEICEKFSIEATLYDLVRSFAEIIKQAEQQPRHEVDNFQLTIEEQVEYILAQLDECDQTTLENLIKLDQSRLYYIVTFLALLELIKLQRITVRQQCQFGDVHVFRV